MTQTYSKFLRTVLIAFLCVLGAVPVSAKIIDEIAAQVNHQIITLSDLHRFRKEVASGQYNDQLLIPNNTVRKSFLANRNKLLDLLIDEKIIDHEIKKDNLTVPVEQIEDQIRGIAHKYNLTLAQFRRALHQQGLSMHQYRKNMKRHLERQALISRAITSKVKISQNDVISYYMKEKHKDPAQIYSYTIADIIYPVGSDGDEGALRKAQKTLLEVKQNNQDFASIANHVNGSATGQDGVLGTFKADELSPEFKTSVAKLQVGEISGIIKSHGAYHILKLLKRQLVPNPDFEQHEQEIRKLLTDQAYKKQFQFWLAQKRQKAYIEKNI